MSQFVVALPVIVAALYSIFVGLCVTGRMNKKTNHLVRIAVISAAGLSFWAILRTIAGNWELDWTSIGHGISVIIAALVISRHPRIPT
jgi:hypothetical protein